MLAMVVSNMSFRGRGQIHCSTWTLWDNLLDSL